MGQLGEQEEKDSLLHFSQSVQELDSKLDIPLQAESEKYTAPHVSHSSTANAVSIYESYDVLAQEW